MQTAPSFTWMEQGTSPAPRSCTEGGLADGSDYDDFR